MRFVFSITFFYYLISLSLIAQNKPTGKMEGYVFDSISGEIMPFVNISLLETKYHTTTNIEGYFVLDSIPEGKYVISLSFVGYSVMSQSLEIKDKKSYKFYMQAGFPKIDDPVLPPQQIRMDSTIFKQKFSKNGILKKETKKTVPGDGNRSHQYVYITHKYNYKNQLFESVYCTCRFNIDTTSYRKYTYNDKKQIVGIETKTSSNPHTIKESLYYDTKGKIIKKEQDIYNNGMLYAKNTIQYQYTYDENGALILEEETVNGVINYSKKYK